MQTQVFHIVTFGCQMNINDSGWLSRALTDRGFTEGSLDSASIVIVNTCSVREKPELKVRSMLGRIRQETENNPGVIVAVIGCVAQQLGTELFSYSPQVRLVSGPDGLSRIFNPPPQKKSVSLISRSTTRSVRKQAAVEFLRQPS